MANQLDEVDILPTDIVVSVHACGALTDLVLARAVNARARVAVLPCCHDIEVSGAGALTGWMDADHLYDQLGRMFQTMQVGGDNPGIEVSLQLTYRI